MKTLKNTLILAIAFSFIVACKNDKQPEVKTVETEVNKDAAKELDANARYAKAEFTIEGMTCAIGCAKTIEKKMANMEGVKSAKVDFGKKIAMVEYDEAKVTTSSLEEIVAKAGESYTVKDMKTVEIFTTNEAHKEACKGKSKEDCKKACTGKDKAAAKEACDKDCKKECCEKKEKI